MWRLEKRDNTTRSIYASTPCLLWSADYCTNLLYLSADEIKAPSVGTQVDEVLARAEQAQFVGLTSGRLSVHLIGIRSRPVDVKNRVRQVGLVNAKYQKTRLDILHRQEEKSRNVVALHPYICWLELHT